MDYNAALCYLDGLINHETIPHAGRIKGLRLETMQRLMWSMDEPQKTYPTVHVTGTNGKGSTVRITSQLLQAMGLSVGAYTSPHLVEPTERIEVNTTPIDTSTFGASIGRIAHLADFLDIRPTWFETVTAAALAHFADVAVDVAVVEVGMLGRFDATNVVDGTVAVLTNVGFDHTDGYGDWRRAVAYEKAGIVKSSSVVVCGETNTVVRDIFRAEQSQSVLERDRDFGVTRNLLAVGGRLIDAYTHKARYGDLFVSLHGAHQADNASLALTTAEAFFDAALPTEIVTEVMGGITMPGRFEIVGYHPLVVLDSAHNTDGARSAALILSTDFLTTGQRILVLGMQTGHDLPGVIKALDADTAAHLIVCTAPTARGVPAADIATAASSLGVHTEVCEDPVEALHLAKARADHNDVIMATGSFTVVGAIKKSLTP